MTPYQTNNIEVNGEEVVTSSLETLRKEITRRQELSGNASGCTEVELMQTLHMPEREITPALRALYLESFIRVSKGINHRLIFLT